MQSSTLVYDLLYKLTGGQNASPEGTIQTPPFNYSAFDLESMREEHEQQPQTVATRVLYHVSGPFYFILPSLG